MWRSASDRFLPWNVRNGLLARPDRTGRDSRPGRSVHRAVHALAGGNVAPVEAWLLLFPHQQEKGMSSVPEWMRRSDCPSRVHAGVGYTSGGMFRPSSRMAAESTQRCRSLQRTASKGMESSSSCSACNCSRPRSDRCPGRCPWRICEAFSSVSPCRTR